MPLLAPTCATARLPSLRSSNWPNSDLSVPETPTASSSTSVASETVPPVGWVGGGNAGEFEATGADDAIVFAIDVLRGDPHVILRFDLVPDEHHPTVDLDVARGDGGIVGDAVDDHTSTAALQHDPAVPTVGVVRLDDAGRVDHLGHHPVSARRGQQHVAAVGVNGAGVLDQRLPAAVRHETDETVALEVEGELWRTGQDHRAQPADDYAIVADVPASENGIAIRIDGDHPFVDDRRVSIRRRLGEAEITGLEPVVTDVGCGRHDAMHVDLRRRPEQDAARIDQPDLAGCRQRAVDLGRLAGGDAIERDGIRAWLSKATVSLATDIERGPIEDRPVAGRLIVVVFWSCEMVAVPETTLPP